MTLTDAPTYNPFDAAFQADPYPAYRQLRDHDPVHRHEQEGAPAFWALSRFDDIWNAVRDSASFSSEQGLTFYPDEIGQLGLAPTIVMLDPPRHTKLRSLIAKGFTPHRVMSMEPLIREFVRSRIDLIETKARAGEQVDLHQDFSTQIPTFVLAELFDIPESDRMQFDPWVTALTALQDSGFDIQALGAQHAVAEMFGYFGELITARRAAPGEDMISALTQAELDGERLTDWDILGFCFVLVAGGNDTTGNLISHGVMLLDGDHAQRERLVAEPDLIPNALVEFLRLESSVQGLARTTLRPVRIGDVEIPEGEKVMMLYGSANRDEREYGESADRLDITRQFPRHLAFSSGVHFCIGSHLARLQARLAFEELLARQPHIGVDLSGSQRLNSAFTRGWVHLPATGIR
ncbi:cytochrome P450 [Rhodococcus sp. D2-41]|uniref:cytochrome P450 n=1 Tax=Speluncibacter jeojiensis TaxID=2710754 RepID=UPI00240EF132|nr:cytochrome P450 [Rhodococcus sp. D2-41]MDG3012345.1 cytochrome P450 [Rhodococcus sp. D2-41]